MVGKIRSRASVPGAFATAAAAYWLDVFPRVSVELHHWRERAQAIPDRGLRRLALATQRAERGNVEGAAAFAVLAARAARPAVVRAAVAFQAAYDYVDTLAEQPSSDPVANARALHRALPAALDLSRTGADHEAQATGPADGGYLRELTEACRRAFATLPSGATVAAQAIRAARRMAAYQALCHAPPGERHALRAWALRLAPGSGLRWWEAAAGAASSLPVFALLAAAATPGLRPRQAALLERAYFPWIGALHVLLDSLIDRVADSASGHVSLISHYRSPEEMAERLHAIASRARAAAVSQPAGARHGLLLAAMASFYLSAPGAHDGGAAGARARVLEAIGPPATPSMAILRARRWAGTRRPACVYPET